MEDGILTNEKETHSLKKLYTTRQLHLTCTFNEVKSHKETKIIQGSLYYFLEDLRITPLLTEHPPFRLRFISSQSLNSGVVLRSKFRYRRTKDTSTNSPPF